MSDRLRSLLGIKKKSSFNKNEKTDKKKDSASNKKFTSKKETGKNSPKRNASATTTTESSTLPTASGLSRFQQGEDETSEDAMIRAVSQQPVNVNVHGPEDDAYMQRQLHTTNHPLSVPQTIVYRNNSGVQPASASGVSTAAGASVEARPNDGGIATDNNNNNGATPETRRVRARSDTRRSSEETLYDHSILSENDDNSFSSEQTTIVPRSHAQAILQNYRTVLRKIPFITVLIKNGVYCFSSEQSLTLFKDNKRKHELFTVGENDEVLGVPLFHCIAYSLIKGLLTKSPITHRIFKYIAVPCNSKEEPILPDNLLNPQLICFQKDKKYALYKFEYCLVSENNSFFTNSLVQYLNFQLPDRKSGLKYQGVLKSGVYYRYTEAKLSYKPNLKLRWLGTSSLASVFGSLNFKLAVFDNFYDQEDRDENQPQRRPTILGTWACFNNTPSFLPKKRTIRCGDLLVGEAVFQNQPVSGSFTQDTEAIVCMVFILYDHEIRKERGTSTRAGFPLSNGGFVL